jgi:hypothetical protein
MQHDYKERDPAAKALARLGTDPRSASAAARIRRLLPDIEAAISRGVRHADIIATLAEEGLRLTLGQFRTELWRARHKRQADQGRQPAPQRPAPKSKAERDAWAKEMIPDEPVNPLLERLRRKQTQEGGDK